jgi:hypothetical protein
VKLIYSTPDPGRGPESQPRTALAVREVLGIHTATEVGDTLARAAFAWTLAAGGQAGAEAAELAIIVGVAMRRQGKSDATALGRVKELVAAGVRLEGAGCEALARLVESHVSPCDCSVYFAALEDLRNGEYHQMALHPDLKGVMPISSTAPWPELLCAHIA